MCNRAIAVQLVIAVNEFYLKLFLIQRVTLQWRTGRLVTGMIPLTAKFSFRADVLWSVLPPPDGVAVSANCQQQSAVQWFILPASIHATGSRAQHDYYNYLHLAAVASSPHKCIMINYTLLFTNTSPIPDSATWHRQTSLVRALNDEL